ncbi:MAG: hypothetical protein Kow0010_08740 [Dehalococcoidia bacterium]
MIPDGGGEPMTSVDVCSVCGDPVEAHTEAFCNVCGQRYHLNQRLDLPGKDCGEVWINEEHLALEFACRICIEAGPEGAGSLDDILDLAEAALLAGVTGPELQAAAEAGHVAHRRTSGGIFLFERRAIIAFRERRR